MRRALVVCLLAAALIGIPDAAVHARPLDSALATADASGHGVGHGVAEAGQSRLTHRYWYDTGRAAFVRQDLATGVTDAFLPYVPDGLVQAIAVNRRFIFWATRATIGRARLDGSDLRPDLVTIERGSGNLYATDTRLFWTERSNRIRRTDVDGRRAPRTVVSGATDLWDLAGTGSWLYWVDDGAIRRAHLDGSGARTVLTATKAGNAVNVTVDRHHLYWRGFLRVLGRATLDGGNADPGWGKGVIDDIQVGPDYLYGTTGDHGRPARMPLDDPRRTERIDGRGVFALGPGR